MSIFKADSGRVAIHTMMRSNHGMIPEIRTRRCPHGQRLTYVGRAEYREDGNERKHDRQTDQKNQEH